MDDLWLVYTIISVPRPQSPLPKHYNLRVSSGFPRKKKLSFWQDVQSTHEMIEIRQGNKNVFNIWVEWKLLLPRDGLVERVRL